MFKSEPVRPGKTYKFTGPTKLYITVNKDAEGCVRELFINSASSGSTIRSLCEALGKIISIALQSDSDLVERVIRSFEDDLSESFWHNRTFPEPAKSIPDAISKILEHERHG